MGGKSTGRSTSMPSSPKTASSQGRSTRKRALSAISRDSGGKRRAKGGAAQPSTPFKTPAAKSQKLSEEPSSAGSGVSSATSSDNESGSEYGQEERRSDPKTSNSSSSSSSGGSQAGEPSSSDEAVKPKSDGQRRGATKSTAATARANAQGDSIWRAGVKTGLGPGTEVYIKKPKARDAGTTAYTDETVHPNTMLFLRDLARNNDREWLKGGCRLARQQCSG